MRPKGPPFTRLTTPVGIALFLAVACVVAMIEIGVLEYTYAAVGIGHRAFAGLLFLSLLGSVVNFPVARLRAADPGPVAPAGTSPASPAATTLLAVNVGGALVPAGLSLYLVAVHGFAITAAIAVAIVAIATHWVARPTPGVGIAVPIFLPPVIAASVAILLGGPSTPALAYVAGTLGTLIGADLSNLGRIRTLGVPAVSIGGAGTFDGVFLTGVLAVLLA